VPISLTLSLSLSLSLSLTHTHTHACILVSLMLLFLLLELIIYQHIFIYNSRPRGVQQDRVFRRFLRIRCRVSGRGTDVQPVRNLRSHLGPCALLCPHQHWQRRPWYPKQPKNKPIVKSKSHFLFHFTFFLQPTLFFPNIHHHHTYLVGTKTTLLNSACSSEERFCACDSVSPVSGTLELVAGGFALLLGGLMEVTRDWGPREGWWLLLLLFVFVCMCVFVSVIMFFLLSFLSSLLLSLPLTPLPGMLLQRKRSRTDTAPTSTVAGPREYLTLVF
jgi:hypothetical protein